MIGRRAFCAATGAALATRATGGALAAGATGAPRPNIVMLLADDLGYADLGCYGHPTIRTPNLDRMAREGMRFTQFYAPAPVCSPSRAALMTGRLPIRTGVIRVLFPRSSVALPDGERTIAQVLGEAGYETACIGKWHLGDRPEHLPTHRGFHFYFGIPYSNDMTKVSPYGKPVDYPPLPLIRGDRPVEEEPDQSLLTRRFTEEAVAFIRRTAGRKPFFLYLAYHAPHVPLAASQDFRGKSPRGLYGDVVEELDWSVGEVLRQLEASGLDRNTLVLFSSDNGPGLIRRTDAGNAGLLRDGKGTTWEGGMRAPLLARWPGVLPAARTTQAFGTLMDILPTCARLAGAAPPADRPLDGRDLTDVLRGQSEGREAELFYYVADRLQAIRQGPWKLHIASNSVTGLQQKAWQPLSPPLLFHLLHDPSELFDVAAKNPDVVERLLKKIELHRQEIAAERKSS
jgi:arylsulfatase